MDKILAKRVVGLKTKEGGRVQYRVAWKVGGDGRKYKDTWSDLDRLGQCAYALDAFQKQKAAEAAEAAAKPTVKDTNLFTMS